MNVIATVGLPGSGKSEAATVARDLGIPVVTMGDVIREECQNRGLNPAEHHGRIAQALREEDGPDAIAARSIPLIEAALEETDTVLIDGIRSGVEVERFEEAFGEDFTLVNIDTPYEVREERVETRGRDKSADEGGEDLTDRDERELGFGMDEAMDRADVIVENVGTLPEFHEKVHRLLVEQLGVEARSVEEA